MSKLSDLFKAKDRSVDALTPSEAALHALKVNEDGLLTYTKVLWNSDESIDMSNGEGFAYNGVEEFVEGLTLSGTLHNLIPAGSPEVGEKDIVGYTIHVTTANNQFLLDGKVLPVLLLTRGATYKFQVTDSTTANFPLYISTEPTGNNYTYQYLNGISNSRTYSGSTLGPLEFTVPPDAPNTLYYASGNHANCYGKILIQDTSELTNLNHRNFDQVRFDNQKLTYYVNSDGFLVARYGQDYNYS